MTYFKKYILALFAVIGIIYFGRWYNNAQNSSKATVIVSNNSKTPASSPNTSIVQPQTEPNNPNATTTWRDGSYTGQAADAYYGNVQVKVNISGGKIVDVSLLDYPQDNGNSQRINSYAVPQLKSEAIQTQRDQVDVVSGASFTSQAFNTSLSSALSQAR